MKASASRERLEDAPIRDMASFGSETIPMVSTDHWCRSVRACRSLLSSAPPLPLADKVVVATWMIVCGKKSRCQQHIYTPRGVYEVGSGLLKGLMAGWVWGDPTDSALPHMVQPSGRDAETNFASARISELC